MYDVDPYHGPESDLHRNLLSAALYVERTVNTALRPTGVSLSQFYILLLLNTYPGLTRKEIGAKLLTERVNITEILERMQRDKLIRREPHPSDRRSLLVYLTPRGRELMEAAIVAYGPAIRGILSVLDREEMERISAALLRLRDAAKDRLMPETVPLSSE